MGSLPAILGLVVLFVVFGLANDRFLSALNMANLITQAGAIMVLAMGLVMVLLLGDIDLSAGVAGGVVGVRHGPADRQAATSRGTSRCWRHWSRGAAIGFAHRRCWWPSWAFPRSW